MEDYKNISNFYANSLRIVFIIFIHFVFQDTYSNKRFYNIMHFLTYINHYDDTQSTFYICGKNLLKELIG